MEKAEKLFRGMRINYDLSTPYTKTRVRFRNRWAKMIKILQWFEIKIFQYFN